MLQGDIYYMRERVREEYPNHDIIYVGDGRYQVIEKRKQLRYEGDLDGCPLFSMVEISDIVFEFNHTPDMRVLQRLRNADIWRHPRGPIGWYEERVNRSQKRKQRRQAQQQDDFAYVARENHRNIMNEYDGLAKSTF